LGELGLLGFILAAAGASKFWFLLAVQILLLGWFLWRGTLQSTFLLLKSSVAQITSSAASIPAWMKWAAALAVTLTFLMTLLPPADAFDALLYHLTVPAHWLQDGGIRPYNFPHYWFPGLVEGAYVWALGLASDILAQQIHFAWTIFTVLLVWDWARRLWGHLTAWWALMLMVSMPSLLIIASWAYTDMALSFFGVAMLYTLSQGRERDDARWWNLSALSAGMAMGVKYTSFVMPVTAVLLLSIWQLHQKKEWVTHVIRFSLLSLLTASPWYLRNWVWMGNPFYPFVFGGRYWDIFRAAWYANAGSGIGWDLKALVFLPLTVTLGYQDVNSIDSDIGPLLLLVLPFALWILARREREERSRRITLTTIAFFGFFSAVFWVYGYITTRNLWQTRLLLPAIIPFVILAAAGLTSISSLDTKRLRLGFIVSGIAAAAIYVNLLDMGLSVIARNPLSIAAGITPMQIYLERYQPGYAQALGLISQTPSNAKIYVLFEPRSYGMDRTIQCDPILDNFSHDVYLYGDPETIVNAWRMQGYTYVLLKTDFAASILESTGQSTVFDRTIKLLKPSAASPDGSYELLEVPAASSVE
jgi:hypothetical protein